MQLLAVARQSLDSRQAVVKSVVWLSNCQKSVRFVIFCAAYGAERLFSLVVFKPNFNKLADSQGVDDELPRSKDQKKIQIEIRRNIPKDKISDSTVRRSIRDPQTVLLARKKGLYFYFLTFPVGF